MVQVGQCVASGGMWVRCLTMPVDGGRMVCGNDASWEWRITQRWVAQFSYLLRRVHTPPTPLAQQLEEVGGGFDPSAYVSEIIWADSGGINGRDPASIPVSLSYRRDTMAGNGSNKCILHG